MKKYIIIETWNGEGYSEENRITEIIELKNDAQALQYCSKLAAESQQPAEFEAMEDRIIFTKEDDAGAFHFRELKDEHFAVSILCNVNSLVLHTKEEYENRIYEQNKQALEEACNGEGRHFFGAGEFYDDYDVQFEVINREKLTGENLSEDNLEWVDSGDGVSYEIWIDKDGQLYRIPIEIVRYFDDAEKVNSSHEAKFGTN